jgi:methylenetetrahydrofolate reductase (NADPH)
MQWVDDCKAAGVNATFIPGLMPILGYERFQRTINFCKTNVPPQLAADLEEIKADDEKVREFGVNHMISMC